MAIEAREIVLIYNYERNMCPGCALACFRLWLRHNNSVPTTGLTPRIIIVYLYTYIHVKFCF